MLAIVRSLTHWRAELVAQTDHQRFQVFSDHKALEYFMTTKKLTGRQARWSELLADFYFMVMYRPGNQNAAADALSRREQDVNGQIKTKDELRTRSLIHPSQIDPRILRESDRLPDVCTLAPVDFNMDDETNLVAELLDVNRTHDSLMIQREEAKEADSLYTIREDGLLLSKGRLWVPDVNDLRTRLIQHVHDQVATAHPGKSKTFGLLRTKYYWPGLLKDIPRFIANCHACNRANHRRDKTPGYLHPLPILDHPWQHLTMDFKSAPKDKAGYDSILVVMDRLSKEAVSIPCHT